MSEVEAIKKIVAAIKKRIKTMGREMADIQRFVTGDQKTRQDLLDELDGLFVDITAFTDTPKRFLNLFTSTERRDIHDELTNIDNYIEHTDLKSISNPLDRLKKIIRSVYTRYTESKYDELDKRLLAFEKQKENFTTKIEDSFTKTDTLIDKTKTALGYATTKSIAEAFRKRLHKIEPPNQITTIPSALWIFGSIIFVIIALCLSREFIEAVKTNDAGLSLNVIFARLSIIGLPIAGVWFCAGQYTKLKNIAEDYAYKTVLVESIIGFSEQLKDGRDNNEVYKGYIRKTLGEIHHHPLKNHKKYNENNVKNPTNNTENSEKTKK